MPYTCISTIDREPRTDQGTSIGTTQVHLGEPMSFSEDTCRSRDEVLLTGAEMTHWQLQHQNPDQHGWEFTKAVSPEHTVVGRQLKRLENILVKSRWYKPLPGSGSCLPCRLDCLLLEGHSLWIFSVSRTSQSYFELFTLLLSEFPCWMKHINLRGNCCTILYPFIWLLHYFDPFLAMITEACYRWLYLFACGYLNENGSHRFIYLNA